MFNITFEEPENLIGMGTGKAAIFDRSGVNSSKWVERTMGLFNQSNIKGCSLSLCCFVQLNTYWTRN